MVLGLFTDTEVLAVTQYLSHYWPWLYHGSSLSAGGIGVAAGLEAVLVVLNWFGIRLFAQVNLVVTWVKFIVPAITVIALFASGFHGSNLTSAGGFAPYGGSAILSVISTGGLIYALNGFQPPVDLSGEARNPRRDIPRSILVAIAASAVLYILLQLAFLVAIPHSLLGHGWNGISFTSPFGQLALLVNLGWLSSLLYVDAVISPSGSEFVGTAEGARQTYALSKNGLLPKYFLSVPGASGVPRRALLLNFILGLLVLIPLHSWITLVTYLSDVFVLSYAVSAIAAGTFRSAAPTRLSGWIPGIKWIAPISFILSTEIAYWSGWSNLRIAFPVTLIGAVLFFLLRANDQPPVGDVKPGSRLGAVRSYVLRSFRAGDRPLVDEVKAGAWLIAYLLVLVLFSGIGSYGGQGWIGQPWDSIAVAVVSVGIYLWAVRLMRGQPMRRQPPRRGMSRPPNRRPARPAVRPSRDRLARQPRPAGQVGFRNPGRRERGCLAEPEAQLLVQPDRGVGGHRMEKRDVAPRPDARAHRPDQPGREPVAAPGLVGADRADLRPPVRVQPLPG